MKNDDVDKYLDDFATMAMYFVATVAIGMAGFTALMWWIWTE